MGWTAGIARDPEAPPQRYNVLPQFIPPGPIAAAWIMDSATPMPFIRGPAGSGKTTSAVYKGPYALGRLMPVCTDGIIRARLTVIRDNYRRLAETALKSWKLVFAEDFPYSKFEGGQDRPVHHTLELDVFRAGYPRAKFPLQKRIFRLEVDFFAVGDHAIEEMLRGYETSAGWLNEADLLNDRVAPFLYSRTARYPSKLLLPDELLQAIAEQKAKLFRQVWGDLNPPDTEHWVERWDREKHPGFKLYKQPSGLASNAENRKGKSRAEYEAELLTLDTYDAQRFVYGQPGYARDGIPVYLHSATRVGFQQEHHVAGGPIKIVKELPLCIGFDAGGQPSAIVGQEVPNGTLHILREVVTQPITGSARFIELMLMLLLGPDFRGMPVGLCFGDPSAFYGADKENGELAWMEAVARGIGHNIQPCGSNEIGLRIDSVQNRLKSHSILIDPSCTTLIGGFAAHYKLGKDIKGNILNGGKPVKNDYSHPHDACQYLCLGLRGRAGVIEDSARAMRPGNVIPITAAKRHDRDFSVFDV